LLGKQSGQWVDVLSSYKKWQTNAFNVCGKL